MFTRMSGLVRGNILALNQISLCDWNSIDNVAYKLNEKRSFCIVEHMVSISRHLLLTKKEATYSSVFMSVSSSQVVDARRETLLLSASA